MTWFVRVSVVLLAAGMVLVAVAGPDPVRARFWQAAVAAAVLLGGLVASDLAQRRVVRGPRLGSNTVERLFDDALRAALVLDIANAPMAIAVVAVTVALAPLNSVHRGGASYAVIFFLPAPAFLGFVVMNLATMSARRRFLRAAEPAGQAG